ncbi:MAG: nicotinate (nicotinamide) nucleotide adenylyltransferase [Burkholderiaceae bacterium]
MSTAETRQRIGLLGGSFDPIHVAHLALGRAAAIALALDEVRLVPTGHSWQKGPQRTPAADRLAMARIALGSAASEGRAGPGIRWTIDDIEVRRNGPSYTVETLIALRKVVGAESALVLLLGSDQLRNLPTWHRWRELLDHAHIAVTRREQVSLSDLPPAVEDWFATHGAERLPDTAAGTLVTFRMPSIAVSATGIRQQLARGEDPGELLPPGVLDYIRRHRLYGNG